ncbi:MAG: SDR family oxidoreductase [Gammaproteobacteria bacterium]|nr:SDR family oxidoreductase [Gammaproteobacteria bacterium]NNF48232.1 SDR family oxidoreductase [Woeseiaceae bacterium]MBT8094270.1 SDR family oxidoreductase [Gammaproteobacteria bacterium]MBT8104531.1 SDR family oxidoreductase [Gammaproteobacteria bacterium]NNK24545.1 SDR family oxidoreductase [Woeseiaceae bacterium]
MGDPQRLYGLNALVLNAADGIGEAIARTLIKHGATVVAADTANSGVEQHYHSVKGITGKVCSLTDTDSVSTLVSESAQALGSLDIVVTDFPLRLEALLSKADKALETVIKQRASLVLAAYRAALPHLKKSPAGRIINLGLLRSFFTVDGADAAARAEQDLADLTRAMAAETGEHGITANYIQPGGVMTPESRDTFRRNEGLRDYCIKRSASRRIGEPVDVAKVALFLASDDSAFVSGTGIAVDGGRLDD